MCMDQQLIQGGQMRLKTASLVVLALFLSVPHALAVDGIALGLERGWNGVKADSYQLALVWKPRPAWFELWGGQVDGNVEAGINYTKDTNAGDFKVESVTGVSLVGLLRWRPDQNSRFYLELGTGPTLLSDSEFGDRELSTSWHFRNTAGIGWQFGQQRQAELAYRLIHISNGGTNLPNPGLDLMAIQMTYYF